jgi:hypothetical protein
MRNLPLLRRSAAARLRDLAERLEPRPERPDRSPAPLVRLDGRWWYRDEIVAPSAAVEPSETPSDEARAAFVRRRRHHAVAHKGRPARKDAA